MANPVAAVASVGLLLDFVGEKVAAAAVETWVSPVLLRALAS